MLVCRIVTLNWSNRDQSRCLSSVDELEYPVKFPFGGTIFPFFFLFFSSPFPWYVHVVNRDRQRVNSRRKLSDKMINKNTHTHRIRRRRRRRTGGRRTQPEEGQDSFWSVFHLNKPRRRRCRRIKGNMRRCGAVSFDWFFLSFCIDLYLFIWSSSFIFIWKRDWCYQQDESFPTEILISCCTESGLSNSWSQSNPELAQSVTAVHIRLILWWIAISDWNCSRFVTRFSRFTFSKCFKGKFLETRCECRSISS